MELSLVSVFQVIFRVDATLELFNSISIRLFTFHLKKQMELKQCCPISYFKARSSFFTLFKVKYLFSIT